MEQGKFLVAEIDFPEIAEQNAMALKEETSLLLLLVKICRAQLGEKQQQVAGAEVVENKKFILQKIELH